jgi:hypothetical protein
MSLEEVGVWVGLGPPDEETSRVPVGEGLERVSVSEARALDKWARYDRGMADEEPVGSGELGPAVAGR